jgi:hypothetical protein
MVKVEDGRLYLIEAFDAYNSNSEVLSSEEFGRVCMTLSTIYRLTKDVTQQKRFLELAKDKVSD